MSGNPVEGCSSCARAWRHCHELWVVHRDGGECTGHDDCDVPEEAHEQVLCGELVGSCRCD